ncbi:MAG: 5'-nucleotidase, lipoprotein e(P4) family [Flavisolibacter sp.]
MKKFSLFLLIFLSACASTKQAVNINMAPEAVADGKLFAALFQQKAAEYRALCLQSYQLARLRLDQELLQPSSKPKAIITDIDETILDNSPYAVHQALQGKDYDQNTWYQWTARADADTVPGASAFLHYASTKGVAVFYITNRDEKERQPTLENLRRYQLPDTDNEHLFPKQNSSSKESRRQQVMSAYQVVLLLGDNLADFSNQFDKKTTDERTRNVDLISHLFGSRYIVLPNPGYGDWESSLYQYNYSLTLKQKDSIIRTVLKSY